MKRPIGWMMAALLAAAFVIEAGETFYSHGRLGFAQPAAAVVGRPLTPVSVAGVTRRTVRRCAVGVYVC